MFIRSLLLFTLTFSSLGWAQDFTQYENRVLEAYLAYYGRPADPGGLAYWSNRLEAEGGSLDSIIDEFGESAEYQERFGNLTDTELVTNLYQQLFGRDPDAGGLNFYVERLRSGEWNLQKISLVILDGVQGEDITIISNRTRLAEYYVTLSREGALQDLSATELANLVSSVNGGEASVQAAMSNLDELSTNEPAPTSAQIAGTIENGMIVIIDESDAVVGYASSYTTSVDPDEQIPFVLNELSLNTSYRLYFISDAVVYSIYSDSDGNGYPDTNAFHFRSPDSVDLGRINYWQLEDGRVATERNVLDSAAIVPEGQSPILAKGLEGTIGLSQSAVLHYEGAIAAIRSGWFLGAESMLENALASQSGLSRSQIDEARFMLALTNLVSPWFMVSSDGDSGRLDRLGDLLDILDVPNNYTRGDPGAIQIDDGPHNTGLSTTEIYSYLEDQQSDALDSAISNLNSISSNFRFMWERHGSEESLELDYSDVALLQGYLNFEKANLLISSAYNRDAALDELTDANSDETIQSFLTSHPNFLKLNKPAQLSTAKVHFLNSLNHFLDTISRLLAETDEQSDDLVRIDSATSEDIQRTRSYLGDVRSSTQSGSMEIGADWDTDPAILNLQRFFSNGIDFRGKGLLPAFQGNSLDPNNPCLPDDTFNGVILAPSLNKELGAFEGC